MQQAWTLVSTKLVVAQHTLQALPPVVHIAQQLHLHGPWVCSLGVHCTACPEQGLEPGLSRDNRGQFWCLLHSHLLACSTAASCRNCRSMVASVMCIVGLHETLPAAGDDTTTVMSRLSVCCLLTLVGSIYVQCILPLASRLQGAALPSPPRQRLPPAADSVAAPPQRPVLGGLAAGKAHRAWRQLRLLKGYAQRLGAHGVGGGAALLDVLLHLLLIRPGRQHLRGVETCVSSICMLHPQAYGINCHTRGTGKQVIVNRVSTG